MHEQRWNKKNLLLGTLSFVVSSEDVDHQLYLAVGSITVVYQRLEDTFLSRVRMISYISIIVCGWMLSALNGDVCVSLLFEADLDD